ncbi:DUF2971 domain-containing protein [Clostridium botulinum]|uniref:DUF2971 domain-containing protein n=1 Tax=Clostridium botulinum TaxID=1491 RepID=A0A0M1M2J4_CLOBO|nr:DUF2971 domain-containing protein [Clostridium botulinum]KOR64111.1 hypothetical protein ADT22_01715 [Clostridium botulinum]MCS6112552.1 DUF2971 domain-containing protein [Clostridium botulinum]NFF88709.1 DUF2971 domain-containing protein [Clostridium botulinum]NFG11217.1 DUF2971 domain-containing protein [Clostridium botulinum]NFL43409.1 DUF2971 domain-containing protein [Clostridium botulinum]
MIKYFYKYTSLREEFFNNLMLRATPFKALNDPFEGLFNKEQFQNVNKNINEYYSKQGYTIDKENDITLDEVMDLLQSDFNDVGIFSFSVDVTNPLMWAHYADQHNGIALEFDYDKPLFQDSIYSTGDRMSRFKKDYLGQTYEFPEKVMYRREMPRFKRPGEVNPDNIYEYY